MTIHEERLNAIIMTREFLLELLNPKLTPKVPKSIRKRAYWCLRHFDTEIASRLEELLLSGEKDAL